MWLLCLHTCLCSMWVCRPWITEDGDRFSQALEFETGVSHSVGIGMEPGSSSLVVNVLILWTLSSSPTILYLKYGIHAGLVVIFFKSRNSGNFLYSVFFVNYIYSYALHLNSSFPLLLISLFSLLPFPSPISPLLHAPEIHCSVSAQEGAGLPWVSTQHGKSSCGWTKLLPSY